MKKFTNQQLTALYLEDLIHVSQFKTNTKLITNKEDYMTGDEFKIYYAQELCKRNKKVDIQITTEDESIDESNSINCDLLSNTKDIIISSESHEINELVKVNCNTIVNLDMYKEEEVKDLKGFVATNSLNAIVIDTVFGKVLEPDNVIFLCLWFINTKALFLYSNLPTNTFTNSGYFAKFTAAHSIDPIKFYNDAKTKITEAFNTTILNLDDVKWLFNNYIGVNGYIIKNIIAKNRFPKLNILEVNTNNQISPLNKLLYIERFFTDVRNIRFDTLIVQKVLFGTVSKLGRFANYFQNVRTKLAKIANTKKLFFKIYNIHIESNMLYIPKLALPEYFKYQAEKRDLFDACVSLVTVLTYYGLDITSLQIN